MAKDISLEEVSDQARRFPGLDSSLKAALICHAQVSVSVNQSKTQHTGNKDVRLGGLTRQDAFGKCLFMSVSRFTFCKRLQRICWRLRRGPHASSRPASMHSVHSKGKETNEIN